MTDCLLWVNSATCNKLYIFFPNKRIYTFLPTDKQSILKKRYRWKKKLFLRTFRKGSWRMYSTIFCVYLQHFNDCSNPRIIINSYGPVHYKLCWFSRMALKRRRENFRMEFFSRVSSMYVGGKIFHCIRAVDIIFGIRTETSIGKRNLSPAVLNLLKTVFIFTGIIQGEN